MIAPRHSLGDLATALRKHRGLIAVAAEDLGLSREHLHSRIRHSKQLQAVLAEARERTTDRAESALFRAIEAGEAWAVCFYLKTQGRSRGYIETHQIDITAAIRQGALALGLDPDDAVRAAEAIVAGK